VGKRVKKETKVDGGIIENAAIAEIDDTAVIETAAAVGEKATESEDGVTVAEADIMGEKTTENEDGAVEIEMSAVEMKENDEEPKITATKELLIAKKERRGNGSGSIWWSANIKKWGLCVQLGKYPNGSRIRHLEYDATRAGIEERLAQVMDNKDGLREQYLIKKGFKAESELTMEAWEERHDEIVLKGFIE
jgi:hypothetical protein